MMFKIKTYGLLSPVRVSVKLLGNQVYFEEGGSKNKNEKVLTKFVDLKVYCSNIDRLKEPTELRNTKIILNPVTPFLLHE